MGSSSSQPPQKTLSKNIPFTNTSFVYIYIYMCVCVYILVSKVGKEVLGIIFWVFGMTRPRIEPQSSGPLAYTLSSSSSCRAASTDISDPLSALLPTVHRLWQEYITYELVPDSPAVSCMSGSSNLDSFRDGRLVAV